jgi:hypothetical protein
MLQSSFKLGTWTHVNTLFVNSLFIKIEFSCAGELDSDLFTKNVGHELYERHKRKILEESENDDSG